ncbi:unnamed protein product, partial [Prorocentrum cordatum]
VAGAGAPPGGAGRAASAGRASWLSAGALGLVAARAALAARRARGGADISDDLSVEKLTKKYSSQIDELRNTCKDVLDDQDDLYLLFFLLESKGDVPAAAENVREVLAWRKGEGAGIVATAEKAIAEATAGGGWNNEPVFAAAPNADKLKAFITPDCYVVLALPSGDLMSVIRAAAIDSPKMMEAVTPEQLVDFFIYAREVNTCVADARTRATGRLTKLISANDLTGVSSFPDSRFQEALTGSSKKAQRLYPGRQGPTVLLNLPWLARALVGLLAPLFPGAVRDKIKFARTPMDYMEKLPDVLREPLRSQFLDDISAVLTS